LHVILKLCLREIETKFKNTLKIAQNAERWWMNRDEGEAGHSQVPKLWRLYVVDQQQRRKKLLLSSMQQGELKNEALSHFHS